MLFVARRGLNFLQQTYRQLGLLEIADQRAGAKELAKEDFINDKRVAIWVRITINIELPTDEATYNGFLNRDGHTEDSWPPTELRVPPKSRDSTSRLPFQSHPFRTGDSTIQFTLNVSCPPLPITLQVTMSLLSFRYFSFTPYFIFILIYILKWLFINKIIARSKHSRTQIIVDARHWWWYLLLLYLYNITYH